MMGEGALQCGPDGPYPITPKIKSNHGPSHGPSKIFVGCAISSLLILQRFPRPSNSIFKGPTSEGRKGKRKAGGRKRKGKEERRGAEVEGGREGPHIWPTQTFWRCAPYGSDFPITEL